MTNIGMQNAICSSMGSDHQVSKPRVSPLLTMGI